MGWVRFHRRYGAWPGFAALALQIVLSFGHIHIGNVHVDAVWRSVVGKSHSVTLAQSPQKSPTRNSGQNSGDDEDYCAVCASIFLATTSLGAAPPLLPVPLGFERVTLTLAAERGVNASRPAFFQSRAPPIA
jgi:hypothetical protein